MFTEIYVPVGNQYDLPKVEMGTAVVILLSFVYLVYISVLTKLRLDNGRGVLKTD